MAHEQQPTDAAHPKTTCPSCGSDKTTIMLVKKFNYYDFGHCYCSFCKISFDSNASEIMQKDITPHLIASVVDEKSYRSMFIATPALTRDGGPIYASTGFADEAALKAGIAGPVIAAIQQRHAPDAALRILDVGCGNGFTCLEIQKALPNTMITGVDPSPLVKELSLNPGTTGVQGTIETAALPPASFDVVSIIGNWMLHPDPLRTLRLAQAALRPGGMIIFDFKNIRSTPRQICIAVRRLGLDKLIPSKIFQRNFLRMRYGFNRDYVVKICKSLELEIIQVDGKPPRLLNYDSRNAYAHGLYGSMWRMLSFIDQRRKEEAWIQIVAKKIA